MNLKQRMCTILSLVFVLVAMLSGCDNTRYVESKNIIEASELSKQLGNSNVIVIDARSKEDYNKGHLDGAISLTADELSIKEPFPGLIASKEQVEKVLCSKGISNDSTLYIYDNKGGVYSARVWWVLKAYGHENVKVINNGQKALELEKMKMSLDIPKLVATSYEAKEIDKDMLVDKEYVKAVISNENIKIIDVRSAAEYDEGAIPKAILYPHTKNLYTDGSFKSSKNIYLSYNELGLKRDDEVILYCKTSFRATQTALLLKEAGFTNIKVYDGAWVEWSNGDMPVEEEKQPIVNTTQDAS